MTVTGQHISNPKIRLLQDVADGAAIVDLFAKLVPAGYDLLDLMEKLERNWGISFGKWREVKDINSTLRTYGEWEEREGSKDASLIHPLGNRANTVIQVNELFDVIPLPETLEYLRLPAEVLAGVNEKTTVNDLIAALPPSCIISRLLVEIRVINIFLEQHPEWLPRIFVQFPAEELDIRTIKLRRLKEMTEQAIQEVLSKLLHQACAARTAHQSPLPS